MSDVANPNALAQIEMKYLLPSEIQVIEEYNVRPWMKDDANEGRLIDRLAQDMEQNGQLDDCVVRPGRAAGSDVGPEWVLFIGHRRRRAAAVINERRTVEGGELFRLRCRVDSSGGDIKRKAIASNLQRKDFSPMDLAQLVHDLKKEHGWEGFKGSKECGKYLNVSTETVTQHEKFLGADSQIQRDLVSGKLTAQNAFMLIDAKPSKVAEVMDAAHEEQAKEDLRKGKAVKVDKQTGKAKPDKIEAPAIRKALRKVEDSTEKDVPRTRKEILEWFESNDGPAYGFPDSAVRKFVRYFCDKWAAGVVKSDKGLSQLFDEAVEKSNQGTKAAQEKLEAKETKAVGKKPAKKGKAA